MLRKQVPVELDAIGLWKSFCTTSASSCSSLSQNTQRAAKRPTSFTRKGGGGLFTPNEKEKSKTTSIFPIFRQSGRRCCRLRRGCFFCSFIYSSHRAPIENCDRSQHFWGPHCPKQPNQSKPGWQNGSNWSFCFCQWSTSSCGFIHSSWLNWRCLKNKERVYSAKRAYWFCWDILNFGSSASPRCLVP